MYGVIVVKLFAFFFDCFDSIENLIRDQGSPLLALYFLQIKDPPLCQLEDPFLLSLESLQGFIVEKLSLLIMVSQFTVKRGVHCFVLE